MNRKTLLFSAALLATAGQVFAGSSAPITTATSTATTEEHNPLLMFDAFRVSGYGAFNMEFDKSLGELDVWQVELHTFLSKPINFGPDLTFLPTFRYEGTFLRYDGTLPGFPLKDEDLHSIELPLYLIHTTPSSPWICGAYLRPALATDFDHIDSDDIFVDAAIGAGYKFSDSFYLGAGLAIEDAFGNEELIPGLAFLWSPTPDLTFQLLGPVFDAVWNATPDWRVGVDIRAAGGAWNIDDNNISRTIDFSSYRAGVHVHRRLVDTWWLEGGAGITFANEMNLKTPNGLGLNEAVLGDLDEGIYGYLAVRKEVW
ncbi:DUF6268 family outer membrane beta-barrel protein [Haloferula sp. BvORR071]|uniref:DUF6268 family outer membrane beta-barrel protein n=1 Tax=Haloferula sp. BvORR071 TaxID=1396141 RepID=UPI002240EBC5|nr:DUF6268 family outer membrane beta-barrel protein [Haloferula sp. BvORR071]